MWSEIFDLIPLPTGLDCCINYDIEQYEHCVEANRINGYEENANFYEHQIKELKRREQELDNMGFIARWWHCRKQYRKIQKEHDKVIKDCKRRLGL